MRVHSGGIVVSAGRDQHAHEICGDPGMLRGAAERLAEIGLGRVVVRIERGGDGDTVGDPGRQRQVPADFLRLPEVLPRRFDPVPRELRATGAEERFRPYRSCVTGQGRGFGEITQRADIVVGAEGDIIKIDSARKDDEILITVIDNGMGITPDRQRSIFKPFYTSRDGAMGIGLALAGHLVGKYEGTVKINSLPGQGTVARITLPAEISRP